MVYKRPAIIPEKKVRLIIYDLIFPAQREENHKIAAWRNRCQFIFRNLG